MDYPLWYKIKEERDGRIVKYNNKRPPWPISKNRAQKENVVIVEESYKDDAMSVQKY